MALLVGQTSRTAEQLAGTFAASLATAFSRRSRMFSMCSTPASYRPPREVT